MRRCRSRRTRRATRTSGCRKAIYKERAATAELVNAQARNHGLQQLPVRGLRKVRAIALWYAHAENFRRLLALGLLGR